MNATNQKIDVASLLPWSDPQPRTTSRGPRLLSRAAPDGAFWSLWRSSKAELQAAGVSVSCYGGQWEACWWQQDPAAEPDCSQDAPVKAPTQAPASRSAAPLVPVPAAQAAQPSGDRAWSQEQRDIFAWFAGQKSAEFRNLVVRARAGTGKTTTIKEAFRFAPEAEMLYAVFNKKNQLEAREKISDPRVDIRTLHSLGFRYVKAVWPAAKPDDEVEDDRVRAAYKDIPDEVCTAVKRLVGFAKNTAADMGVAELADLADERMIECPGYEDEENGGWTSAKLAQVARKVLELSLEKDGQDRVSFNDMVWLPVAKGWVTARYDLVAVDECQDMNILQLLMAIGACRKGGRIVVVGDDKQAIYQFRGAASGGMDIMKQQLGACELGLTTTYRCPKSVVDLAAKLVPDYHAAPQAPEGTIDACIDWDLVERAQVGDAILSRINAPLMANCLALLRKGTPARIEGRDVGKALLGIVKKLKAKSVPHFMDKVEAWGEKQMRRWSGTKNFAAKSEAIADHVATLQAVAEGAASVGEIEKRLLTLFADSGDKDAKPAVVLSSVHRAKGLEWNRTFLLRNTFMKSRPNMTPGDKESESNIYYVALTRTKSYLCFVDQGPRRSRDGTAQVVA